MPDPGAILSVRDLQISFAGPPPVAAVGGISFGVRRGRTLAIVGESGSGKSLTSLALMGLLPKAAQVRGEYTLQTADGPAVALHRLQPQEWPAYRGRHIAMVFQEPMSALNPVMRIGKQLAESIMAHQGIGSRAAESAAVDWLHRVQLPQPEKIYRRYPHQLSGGQKQRVMIAMAMCRHPDLLIADEPTTALDVTVQRDVLQLMRSLQQQYHTAMIFITHDLALAAEMADEVMVLYRGGMVEYGPAADVLTAPTHPYTQALLACRPAAQEKGRRLPVVADFLQEGKTPAPAALPAPQPVTGHDLLQVRDLRVWFPESVTLLGKTATFFKAVDGVSFDLRRGEVLGLVGESGCGKSTLGRSLMGLLPVHSGQILFEGRDLAAAGAAEWRAIRRHIQLIFQDPYSSLNPRMTVGDMLREPMQVHQLVPARAQEREAARLLDLVQLPVTALRRYAHQFSGGQRQRIGIARALALKPQLLICDESVSALDVSVQAQILNLLKDLQAEFRLSYLFISHDLNVVHYISDRVLVMQRGHIVEAGTADQILRHPEHPYTQQLVQAIP